DDWAQAHVISGRRGARLSLEFTSCSIQVRAAWAPPPDQKAGRLTRGGIHLQDGLSGN
ncbi:hypothetical protein scyTo_0014710, partial [Scyliorhinus torazame]|nr:hypothetical protein [Scyliorhinus torazame]